MFAFWRIWLFYNWQKHFDKLKMPFRKWNNAGFPAFGENNYEKNGCVQVFRSSNFFQALLKFNAYYTQETTLKFSRKICRMCINILHKTRNFLHCRLFHKAFQECMAINLVTIIYCYKGILIRYGYYLMCSETSLFQIQAYILAFFLCSVTEYWVQLKR